VFEPPTQPRKRGRPKGSKNRPKEVEAIEPASIQLDTEPLVESEVDSTRSNESEVESPGSVELTEPTTQTPEISRRITRSQAKEANNTYIATVYALRAALSDQEEPQTVQEAKDSPDWSN
jgi:hypothetical protein